MPDARVGVCIPAYEAAAFIDRTLRCARAQTHTELRIVVSVDVSADATAEICHAHAGEDERVEVFVQRERLGWAGNVNFLLAEANAPFAFLYFPDPNSISEPVTSGNVFAEGEPEEEFDLESVEVGWTEEAEWQEIDEGLDDEELMKSEQNLEADISCFVERTLPCKGAHG